MSNIADAQLHAGFISHAGLETLQSKAHSTSLRFRVLTSVKKKKIQSISSSLSLLGQKRANHIDSEIGDDFFFYIDIEIGDNKILIDPQPWIEVTSFHVKRASFHVCYELVRSLVS